MRLYNRYREAFVTHADKYKWLNWTMEKQVHDENKPKRWYRAHLGKGNQVKIRVCVDVLSRV